MKWLGALLILAASTWMGMAAARALYERPRQLRQLKAALRAFEAEVMYGHTPLAEASQHIARQTAAPIGELFAQFAAALHACETSVAEAWEKACGLYGEDRAQTRRVGSNETVWRHARPV